LEQVFRKGFEELSGTILANEGYEFGATDFRTQLSKIKSKKPEALYMIGYWKEIIQILKQMKEIDFHTQILSAICFKEPGILEFAGQEAEGTILTGPFYDPHIGEKNVQNFVTIYKARFNEEPGIWAAHSYDAMKIIGLSIKKGGRTGPEIQKNMSIIKDFKGVTGTMSFDKHGDVIKPIKFYVVKNKKFIPYEEKQ
jgi:branched-chain amino acid transport system substrate-binding protein